MKLPRAATTEKEEFARNLFKSTKLTASVINDSVKAQFKSPLRINRLYELQRDVRGPTAGKQRGAKSGKTAEPIVEANRKGRKPLPVDVTLPQIFHFVVGESPSELLARAVNELRRTGLSTAVVATSTERYALIDSTP